MTEQLRQITVLCRDPRDPTVSSGHALIAGIVLDGMRSLTGRHYSKKARITEQQIRLPERAAQHLVPFYERYYVGPERLFRDWNCHTFVKRMVGQAALSDRLRPLSDPRLDPGPMELTAIVSGHGYAVHDTLWGLMHSFFVVNDGDAVMQVNGNRQPLFLSSPDTVPSAYPGKIYPYAPGSGS